MKYVYEIELLWCSDIWELLKDKDIHKELVKSNILKFQGPVIFSTRKWCPAIINT